MVKARGDYGSEIGWPAYVRQVERHAGGTNVIVASNYGEAGALQLFGRGLPPVASGNVTMRYWRPHVTGRKGARDRLLGSYGGLLHSLQRGRAHLDGRQRRARQRDRALHATRPARPCLARDRRALGLEA